MAAPITKDTYPNIVKTGMLASSMQVVTTLKDLPEDTAYWITKTFWESVPDLKASHPAFDTVTPESVAGVPQGMLPFHPGALKYYKEVGFLK